MIRPAEPRDNQAIAAIWNREGAATTATTDTEPRDAAAQAAWLAGHRDAYPAIVAVEGNEGSLALHERRGFVRVGHERQVALKHGVWLDVVTLQRVLLD
jgi:L-amino acid N-acyltransferase YncA